MTLPQLVSENLSFLASSCHLEKLNTDQLQQLNFRKVSLLIVLTAKLNINLTEFELHIHAFPASFVAHFKIPRYLKTRHVHVEKLLKHIILRRSRKNARNQEFSFLVASDFHHISWKQYLFRHVYVKVKVYLNSDD